MPKNKDETIDLQTTIKTLVNKICTSDEFINEITASIAASVCKKYEDIIKRLENDNAFLSSKVEQHEETICILKSKFENLDQKFRNKSIILYGVKESRSENITKIVLDLANDKLKANIKDYDIEASYRLGKSHRANKHRPIIVYFTTVHTKQKIYNNKKYLKNTGIVMREDLAPDRLEILKLAVENVGQNGQVWTSNGRIFVKLRESNKIVKVESKADAQNL